MKLAALLGGLMLGCAVVWLSGCSTTRGGEGYGAPPDNPAGAPDSGIPAPGNPAYGAYPGPAEPPALQNSAPPPAPPPATFSADHDVAGAIHRLFNRDPNLAPAAKNVTAKVHKGTVTLRGTVDSEHARNEIVQRVSQLPGVDKVKDELKLEEGH